MRLLCWFFGHKPGGSVWWTYRVGSREDAQWPTKRLRGLDVLWIECSRCGKRLKPEEAKLERGQE